MDLTGIKGALEAGLPGCTIDVAADGNRLSVDAVGDIFAGKTRVARQQLVYGVLKDRIDSGEVHAVSMTTRTADEA